MFSLLNEVDWEQSPTESYFNFAKRRLDLVIEYKTMRNNLLCVFWKQNNYTFSSLLWGKLDILLSSILMFEFCNIFGVSLVSFVVFLFIYLFLLSILFWYILHLSFSWCFVDCVVFFNNQHCLWLFRDSFYCLIIVVNFLRFSDLKVVFCGCVLVGSFKFLR